ncbi:MAG TPA: proton-conducting transporter membrane subunit [Planctomycetota bacterium]|nr:proton-conducting transporter membrane subunit [Planctomycetota bacterium]
MALVLILLPMVMAGLALAVPSNRLRPMLVPVTGILHALCTGWAIAHPEPASTTAWLALDPLGRLVLVTVSGLFLFCSIYTVGYLRLRADRANRIFCACMLAYLGLMTLVICSQHLGLMWVGLETTALAGAPLIYFNRTPRSIEATWKYLLVGSIGIALALLGTLFMAYSLLPGGEHSPLTFPDLVRQAPLLSKPWLHAAFVLLLVGYGTKMGLAPMHTWKPDAYGEAPGVVGAMFAGGVTNCAFLAIVRVQHICLAAGESAYTSKLLIFMGLLSMAVAGVFMVGQKDFKRMLAYSSVEAMGILVLGLGIGGAAIYGILLHMVNNAAAKGVLFLSAGNIHRAYGSKTTENVQGALRALPLSGMLFLAGFIAIVGSPPFGPFISEFTILNGAFDTGRYVTGGLFLFLLLVIFIGMGTTVLAVVQGRPKPDVVMTDYKDGWFTGLPPLLLMALVLLLGLYIPGPLSRLLEDAVHFLEVKP